MEPYIKKEFETHKQKIIETYIEWKIGVEIETKPLASPRICLECILKALVIKHFNIIKFNEGDYIGACNEILKIQTNNNNIPKDTLPKWKGTFGIELCLILLKCENKVPEVYYEGIKNIQYCGNLYIHGVKKIHNEKLQKINIQLHEIVDLFFKKEDEYDWEMKYVSPQVTKAGISFAGVVGKELYNNFILNEKQKDSEDIIPFDTSTGNYNILILPFCNPEKYEEISPMGENLLYGLRAKNERHKLGIELKYLSNVSPSEAETVGKNMNADMVIWGDDSMLGDKPHVIYFHFLYIPSDAESKKPYLKGTTEIFETYRLIDIRQGNLHLEIDDVIYWFLGCKFYYKRDYSSALQEYSKIKKGYKNKYLFLYVANTYCYLKNFGKAKAYYKKALRIDVLFLGALNNYAALLTSVYNNFKRAEKHYTKILEIDSSNIEVLINYGTLVGYAFNDFENQRKHYIKALEIDSKNVVALSNYATFLVCILKDFTNAERYYKEALKIKPNYVHALVGYANLLDIMDNTDSTHEHYKKAQTYYEEALNFKPDHVNALIGYASLLYFKLGDINGAMSRIDMALEIYPFNYRAHINYALIVDRSFNKIKIAEVHYKIAIKVNPNGFEAHFNYAHLLINKLNSPRHGRKHYIKAIQLNNSVRYEKGDQLFGIK